MAFGTKVIHWTPRLRNEPYLATLISPKLGPKSQKALERFFEILSSLPETKNHLSKPKTVGRVGFLAKTGIFGQKTHFLTWQPHFSELIMGA